VPTEAIDVLVTPKGEVIATLRGDKSQINRIGEIHAGDEEKATVQLLANVLTKAMDEARRSDSLQADLHSDLVKVLGRHLFAILFSAEKSADPRTLVLERLRKVRVEQMRLRITLEFPRTEGLQWLAALPWEYLHTPLGDDSLGATGALLSNWADMLLSRRIGVWGVRELGVDPRPIRVLLVGSSPTKEGAGDEKPLARVDAEPMLDTLQELDDFVSVLELIEHPPRDADAEHTWAVTRENLETHIAEGPVIVHFVGHGRCQEGHGELALANSDGSPDWIDGETFTDIVFAHANVKAVFLQACESALPDPYVGFSSVAQSLAGRGIPAVVAMQYKVPFAVAQRFASSFYQYLKDYEVDVAVQLARVDLRTNARDEWQKIKFGLPVVYLSGAGQLTSNRRVAPGQQPQLGGDGRGEIPNGCRHCGTPFSSDASFCKECGRPLPWHCHNCGQIFDEDPGRYCVTCGGKVGAPPPADHVEMDASAELADSFGRALQGPPAEAQ
jgi:hypothetical protein